MQRRDASLQVSALVLFWMVVRAGGVFVQGCAQSVRQPPPPPGGRRMTSTHADRFPASLAPPDGCAAAPPHLATISPTLDTLTHMAYNAPMSLPNFLTVSQAAKMLGISTRTLQRWIKSGYIHAVKLSPAGGNSPYRIASLTIQKLKPPPGL